MLWLGMWLWVNGQQGRDNCAGYNFALSRSWQGGCWHPENINTGKTEKYRGFSFVFSRVYTIFASKN